MIANERRVVADYGLPEAPAGWYWYLERGEEELELRLLREQVNRMGLSQEGRVDVVFTPVEFDATPEDLRESADEVMDAWKKVAGDPPHLKLGVIK